MAASPRAGATSAIADEIDRALRFMAACGIDLDRSLSLHQVDFYTSHEALLLGYEEALTRQRQPHRTTGTTARPTCSGSASAPASSTAPTSSSCAASATRSASSSARRPLPRRSLALCDVLDPGRTPGRLTLVTRMGADQVAERAAPAGPGRPRRRPPGRVGLRPHARQHLRRADRATRPAASTTSWPRSAGFFAVHRSEGTWPGRHPRRADRRGRHRVPRRGRRDPRRPAHRRYETTCDPRLNARQALDLAFQVAELLRG